MSMESNKPSAELEVLHNQLQKSLELELQALRDLLANMLEEEHALLRGSFASFEFDVQRTELSKRIRSIQRQRQQNTKELLLACDGNREGRTHLASEHLTNALQYSVENGIETLSIREQILILSDKIKHQRQRNKAFFTKDGNLIKSPLQKEQKPQKKWTMVEEE